MKTIKTLFFLIGLLTITIICHCNATTPYHMWVRGQKQGDNTDFVNETTSGTTEYYQEAVDNSLDDSKWGSSVAYISIRYDGKQTSNGCFVRRKNVALVLPDSTYDPLYGLSLISSPRLGDVDNSLPLDNSDQVFDHQTAADSGYVETFGFLQCLATVESSE